ncbi:hypothetical protein ZWY2020_042472 [Hordeum vulgare]|nr:hypothetical protein ZWY2020_042472 [Hordeum vulgare]
MAAEGDLKLLGLSVSPFVVRVRMALHMKGLSYEYIEQDLFNKSELLLKSNPVEKKVPVLIHDGKTILDSSAIVQYIDEVWAAMGPSILPVDPYDRAASRFWAAYADDKLFSAYVGINRATTKVERAEKVSETVAVLERLEEAFAKQSNGKAFFTGDSVGYLDLAVGCHLHWLKAQRKMFGVVFLEAGRTPLLAGWAKRFAETDAAKEVVPDTDVVMEYAKKRQAYRAAVAVAAATAK